MPQRCCRNWSARGRKATIHAESPTCILVHAELPTGTIIHIANLAESPTLGSKKCAESPTCEPSIHAEEPTHSYTKSVTTSL